MNVPRNPFGQARRRPGWVIASLTGLATVAVVLLLAVLWGAYTYGGPGPEAERGRETTVVLRRGAGLSEIADTLQRAGVIRSSGLFMTAAQVTGSAGQLKAGEYEFPSRSSMADVLARIKSGKIVRHFVTLPEGRTSEDAVQILMNSTVLEGAAPVPEEGLLLPETYDVQRGDDRAAVLQRMIDARETLLRDLWAARAPDLPVRTPQEAVILASIVEKETGIASERPRVAAVFVNRMRQGMRLESDPTVVYGLTGGRPLGRGLRRSELSAPTPYNTYQIPALPPGPITNPGRAALVAVLNPPATDELFFVADGTGGHVFAKTYEEHLRNVEKWRSVERKRATGAQPAAAPAPARATTAG
jgi:UPF0755 protein